MVGCCCCCCSHLLEFYFETDITDSRSALLYSLLYFIVGCFLFRNRYYRQPFHSVPGGWLSKRAAVYNRMAMQSIYREAHPHSCSGLRGDLVQWVPMHSKFVVDLGTGDGDGAATTAKLRPAARVVGVDASPFMIIAGRRQNREVANLEWRHALAERAY